MVLKIYVALILSKLFLPPISNFKIFKDYNKLNSLPIIYVVYGFKLLLSLIPIKNFKFIKL